MTKKELLIEKIKKSVQDREWTNAAIASMGFIIMDCQDCPCGCEYPFGNNCSEKLFNWLENYGDEEVNNAECCNSIG